LGLGRFRLGALRLGLRLGALTCRALELGPFRLRALGLGLRLLVQHIGKEGGIDLDIDLRLARLARGLR
jgi:hypothetical protein